MCGIAGFISPARRACPDGLVAGLVRSLRHRGPDGEGWLTCDQGRLRRGPGPWEGGACQVLFIHRRLSILDLSPAGAQPMSCAQDRLHLTFNGEIYNFIELQAELRALGHTFRTRTDTEVLLAGYQEWGTGVFDRLVGMFAIALLDLPGQKVVLARDGFGIKPLYYSELGQGLCFGSEIKALLEFPEVSREIDPQALCDCLRTSLTDQGEGTLYRAIRQVGAGTCLEISLADPGAPRRVTTFWRPAIGEPLDLTPAQAAEDLRARFLESVRFHIRSDVPVGTALSGGVDSSAIVMAMRMLEPDHEIHTFTYVPEDPGLTEEGWARLVGGAARVIPHFVRCPAVEVARDLDGLVRTQDFPFIGMSIHAQNRVFRLAAEHGIKVTLDGQGADELLGGYMPYTAARLASLVRQGDWRQAARFFREVGRLPGRSMLGLHLGQFLIPPAIQGPFRALAGEGTWMPWMNRTWFKDRGAAPVARYAYTRDPEVLKFELLQTLTETSLPMLLRYADRNSMAYSVESRVPFLTPSLADFIFRVPEAFLIDAGGTTKAVFREAMRGLVPDPVLERKDKIGLQAPGISLSRALDGWIQAKLAWARRSHSSGLP